MLEISISQKQAQFAKLLNQILPYREYQSLLLKIINLKTNKYIIMDKKDC
jgi:hypothetical protein